MGKGRREERKVRHRLPFRIFLDPPIPPNSFRVNSIAWIGLGLLKRTV